MIKQPTINPVQQAQRTRLILLQKSDWTELASNVARHSEQWSQDWQTYRQSLRDVDVNNPVWPNPPS